FAITSPLTVTGPIMWRGHHHVSGLMDRAGHLPLCLLLRDATLINLMDRRRIIGGNGRVVNWRKFHAGPSIQAHPITCLITRLLTLQEGGDLPAVDRQLLGPLRFLLVDKLLYMDLFGPGVDR